MFLPFHFSVHSFAHKHALFHSSLRVNDFALKLYQNAYYIYQSVDFIHTQWQIQRAMGAVDTI